MMCVFDQKMFSKLLGSLSIASLLLLTGCGGSSSGTTTSASGVAGASSVSAAAAAAPSLTLSLVNAAASAVTSISNGSPATVKAAIADANGAAVSGVVVSFKPADATLVTMTPVNGTALTNASGVASIQIAPASMTAAGATSIAASAQVGTTAVNASTGFSIGATVVTVSTPTLGTSTLSAFGTTSVSVTVSAGGVPVTTPQTVNFTSTCSGNGKAKLGTGIATVNGVATASYQDNSCAGTDTITATVGGGLASSTATLTVTAPAVGSIQYVSAAPLNIALKGSGGAPTSLVTFKVVDAGGNPLSGKPVTLDLSTKVGGLSLASYSGISDGAGLVVATVNAGTVSTPVRVTASTPGSVAGTTLKTQSSQLSITTGIPDQVGFTTSAPQHNIEALNIDGVTSTFTARLADHFKNPVPDGTTVNFTAEAGSIVATCNTTAGSCTSTYTSQGTRPANGRVTVLAYAIGEESFTDLNGNGLADLAPVNELIDLNGASTDLPEAWVDYNENGVRDAATEPFIDFNSDGKYNAADGKYSGVLCDEAATAVSPSSTGTCAASKTLHVRSSQVIVLSSSSANVTINGGATIALPVCTLTGPGNPSTFTVTVVDINGNAMPAGTKVDFTTTNGTTPVPASFTVPDTLGCRTSYAGCPTASASATFGDIAVTMKSDAVYTPAAGAVAASCAQPTGGGPIGIFTVTVTSPSGVKTTGTATVTD